MAGSLRGFLLFELKALRDTWGNDSRLQAHNQHLAIEPTMTTWYGANWEEDCWNGIEEFREELAYNVTLTVLDGQLQEGDDDSDAVRSLQQKWLSRRMWTQARQDTSWYSRPMANAKARVKESIVAKAQERAQAARVLDLSVCSVVDHSIRMYQTHAAGPQAWTRSMRDL